MGKKKGKGKGKAKKGGGGGGADGLPPPPEFPQDREGAIEAMLTFQIKEKEDGIERFTDESESFKDRNYQQSSRNNHVKEEKQVHMKKMLTEAKQLADKLRAAENISRSDVEKAMLDKVSVIKQLASEEKALMTKIQEIDKELEVVYKTRDEIQFFREETQFKNKEHIEQMKQTMEKWEEEEGQLESILLSDLDSAKERVDQQTLKMVEKQRERTSEWLMHAMNEETKAEIGDNLWLKEQIRYLRIVESNLKDEIDGLEERNLKLMTEMYNGRVEDLEASCRVLRIASDHSNALDRIRRSSGSLSSLPSAASRTRLTPSDASMVGRSINIGLLSVEGERFPLRPPPQQLSLPPIVEQRNPSLMVQTPVNWPVTNKMLKSMT